jgi:hypothetical protein
MKDEEHYELLYTDYFFDCFCCLSSYLEELELEDYNDMLEAFIAEKIILKG